jgi:hypothetical protein
MPKIHGRNGSIKDERVHSATFESCMSEVCIAMDVGTARVNGGHCIFNNVECCGGSIFYISGCTSDVCMMMTEVK